MNVSACLVTRGDVDMDPIYESLPEDWQVVVWNNQERTVRRWPSRSATRGEGFDIHADLSVYGRYAAIEYATNDLIYVQDDDVIVSDPQAIVDALILNVKERSGGRDDWPEFWDHLVANMPQEFRHDGYTDSCLVGFGACFHRDLPRKAFERFLPTQVGDTLLNNVNDLPATTALFHRDCDVVFTTLTPRVLVDVPKTNREFAEGPDRMYRQPGHVGKRARMLERARMVRDA